MIPACDVSVYQGVINWATMPKIAIIKMSGGDGSLYFDPNATTNYTNAKANGVHVGGYHFIGWTIGATQEASWFARAMSPVAENDVFALDVERGQVAVPPNAVQYVLDMVNYLHNKFNVYPLIYMSLSTLNQFDWSPVLNKCGLWLADWAVSPQNTIPTSYTYVMQQYSDSPNYDHDEWFGTLTQFDDYGYHVVTTPITQQIPKVTTTTTLPTETASVASTTEIKPILSSPPASINSIKTNTDTTSINKLNSHTFTSTPVDHSPSTVKTVKSLNLTPTKNNSSWWNNLLTSIWNFIKNF